MDKQKTITIKINGKDRHQRNGEPGKEENVNREKQAIPGEKEMSWVETAASQEPAEDDFDWILPDPVNKDELKEYKITEISEKPKGIKQTAALKNRKPSGIFPRIALNIFLAILVGTSFGLMILNTVKEEPSNKVQPAQTSPVAPASEAPADPGKKSTETIELPAISSHVVQGGVFSSEGAAEAAINALEGKGIHAQSISTNGQFAIYLATANTLEQAKAYGSDFKAKGADVFAKQLEIPGTKISEIGKEEGAILNAAPGLFHELTKIDSADADSIKAVESELEKLNKISDGKVKNKQVIALKANLESASAAFLSYQKTKDENKKDEVQKANLKVLAEWGKIAK